MPEYGQGFPGQANGQSREPYPNQSIGYQGAADAYPDSLHAYERGEYPGGTGAGVQYGQSPQYQQGAYYSQQGSQQPQSGGEYQQGYYQQYPGQATQPYQEQPYGYSVPSRVLVPQTTVKPVVQSSAVQQADKHYEKGARRGGAWRVVFIIALLVLLVALGIAGYIIFSYWNGQHEYDELTQYMQVEDDGADVITLGSFDVDWDALRAINPDVVGWVYVPGTRINYPIAWREHNDSYYLKKSFGDNSAGDFAAEYGCIMLSGENQPDFSDEVNIIYGHNMRNGSMFEALSHNLDTEYFNAHRTIYLLTPKGNYRLTSYACDRVIGTSTDIVIPNFPTEEEYLQYVEQRIADSSVTPDPAIPDPEKIKKTFAFSTCDYPDNHYRVITFCYIAEYLPAGSTAEDGRQEIAGEDVASVEDLVNQRVS